MNELTTTDDLDVTKLPKNKLFSFFSLVISQEQPVLEAEDCYLNNKDVISLLFSEKQFSEDYFYSGVEKIPNLIGKTSQELESIISNRIIESNKLIKKIYDDTGIVEKDLDEKIKLLENESKANQELFNKNLKIQETEYKAQRKKLNLQTLAVNLGYKNALELEGNLIRQGKPKPKPKPKPNPIIEMMGSNHDFSWTLVAIYISIFTVYPVKLIISIVRFIISLCSGQSILFLRNCKKIMEMIPEDISEVSYDIKDGKPSYTIEVEDIGTTFDYPNSLSYSVAVNPDQKEMDENCIIRYKNMKKGYIKGQDKIQSLISDDVQKLNNCGMEALESILLLQEENYKLTILDRSKTRLSKSLPSQFAKSGQNCIDDCLVYISLLETGRADTWKDAANLAIDDKFKLATLNEMRENKNQLIRSMVETASELQSSISRDINEVNENINEVNENILYSNERVKDEINSLQRKVDSARNKLNSISYRSSALIRKLTR
ncbi:hypothetical protein OZX68_01425 [Streptococcaceae bacterium ESL0729]|nr:hypothetical protein OZX68_01425 [Streptococcaceae bacterium ESL0729]